MSIKKEKPSLSRKKRSASVGSSGVDSDPSDGSGDTSSFLHHLTTGNGDHGAAGGDGVLPVDDDKPAHRAHQMGRVRLLLLLAVLGAVVGYYAYGLVGDRASDVMDLKEGWQRLTDRTLDVDGRLARLESRLSALDPHMDRASSDRSALTAVEEGVARLEHRFHHHDHCTLLLQRLDERVRAGQPFQDVVAGLLSLLPETSSMVRPLRDLHVQGAVSLWSPQEYMAHIHGIEGNTQVPWAVKTPEETTATRSDDAQVLSTASRGPVADRSPPGDDFSSILGRLEKTAAQFLSDHLKIHPTKESAVDGGLRTPDHDQDRERLGLLRTALWLEQYRAAHGLWRHLSVPVQEALGAPFAQQLTLRVLLADIDRLKVYGFPYGGVSVNGADPGAALDGAEPVVDTMGHSSSAVSLSKGPQNGVVLP